MRKDFSLWLNGNSLVLASNALGRNRIDDLLDLQLLAYLGSAGEIPEIDQISDWRNIYQAVQASMGCVFTSLNAQSLPGAPRARLHPVEVMKDGLTKHVPGPEQASLGCAFAALDSLDAPVLQYLRRECISSGPSGHQFNAELRLLLPGPLIIGSELWFGSDQPLLCQWPDWRLDNATVRKASACTTTYILDENLFDSVRELVDQTLEGKRERYRMPVKQAGEHGYE